MPCKAEGVVGGKEVIGDDEQRGWSEPFNPSFVLDLVIQLTQNGMSSTG